MIAATTALLACFWSRSATLYLHAPFLARVRKEEVRLTVHGSTSSGTNSALILHLYAPPSASSV
jgi:hypothetical protein